MSLDPFPFSPNKPTATLTSSTTTQTSMTLATPNRPPTSPSSPWKKDESSIQSGHYHSRGARHPSVSDDDDRHDGNDDDSSVAMELYLRAKMSAVLSSSSSSEDRNETDHRIIMMSDGADMDATDIDGAETDVGSAMNSTLSNINHELHPQAPPIEIPDENASAASQSSSAASSSSSSSAPTTTVVPRSVQPPLTPTATHLYNPYSSYTPSRKSPRREILSVSGLPWGLSPSSSTVETPARTINLHLLHIDDHNDDEADDSDDYDDTNSEVALERWAHTIRMELRHAEMVQVALEAEKAAEAGIETFAGKLSTYGNRKDEDHDLPSRNSALNKKPRPTLGQRSKSVSEGLRTHKRTFLLRRRQHQVQSQQHRVGGIGILELRDVNEVFPSFTHFHNHLRTHFARSRVDERSLTFREMSSSPLSMSMNGSHNSGRRSRLSSDFFSPPWGNSRQSTSHGGTEGSAMSATSPLQPTTTTSAQSSTSDFFSKHRRLSSDLFRRHQRTPSDFLQSFSFDRWINSRHASTDTADMAAVVDVLADHIVSGQPRKLPQVVVPPGLEMPSLEHPRKTTSRQPIPPSSSMPPPNRESPESAVNPSSSSSLSQHPDVATVTTPGNDGSQHRHTKREKHQPRLARALFDDVDPESDAESSHAEDGDHHNPHLTTPQQGVSQPLLHGQPAMPSKSPTDPLQSGDVVEGVPPPPPPDHTDFMTPARLRVIRNSQMFNSLLKQDQENDTYYHNNPLLLTPNSVLDSSEPKNRRLDFRRSNSDLSSSHALLLMPEPGQAWSASPTEHDEPQLSISFRSRALIRDEEPLGTPRSSRNTTSYGLVEAESPDDGVVQSPDRPNGMDSEDPLVPPQEQHSNCSPFKRNVTVKIFASQSDHDDSNSLNTSGGGQLQHSQTISIIDFPGGLQILDPNPADCACLALSPPCSQASACSTPIRKDNDSTKSPIIIEKPHLLRRSSSANALSTLEQAPRTVKWNPFGGGKSSSSQQKIDDSSSNNSPNNSRLFHQTAMSILSRISPKPKTPYYPPQANDDFLHNYLYCSKTPEGIDLHQHEPTPIMCENYSPEICCGSLFPDTSVGMFLSNRRSAASVPILSLSSDNYNHAFPKPEPDSWFDLDHFDFLGRGRPKSSPFNVSFQAPTLRKGESTRLMRADSIVEEEDCGTEEGNSHCTPPPTPPPLLATDEYHHSHVIVEEKKSDELNQHHSRSPAHSRHLSYFPSRQGPQVSPSDTQFELIYGVAPDTLAETLLQDLEAYHQYYYTADIHGRDTNPVIEIESVNATTSSNNPHKQQLVQVDVATFLAGGTNPPMTGSTRNNTKEDQPIDMDESDVALVATSPF